jgi:class 3 adenylate cyclase/tetratricopeptide (TPR) repeat protein
VTVLFADVTGSTALGEVLDAETLRHVMDRYFDASREVVERHGGAVEKFIGDAVMAVFGIPTVHEEDALRAVRAAREMTIALTALNEDLEREWGVRLAIRIGVNTGEVVTRQDRGPGGQRLVTGDAVNVAARLEQAAAPGEILIGEETLRLVRDAVVTAPLEPLTVKGKAEPVATYRLVDVDLHAAGRERRLDSPMVGRDRPLAMLLQAFDAVRQDRACHLFTILGPAGVGKSRLVLEFLDKAPPETLVLRGRCLSYGEGITFWPVVDVIRQAAKVSDTDDPQTVRSKLAAVVAGTERSEAVVDRVAELLGLDEPSGSPEEVFWAVRRIFESLAAARPVVVVFDDIHWAEPTLLDLIEHIADWTKDAPILVLCPARPELLDVRPGWGGGKFNATSILLEPLAEEDCEHLVDHLTGSAHLPPDVRRRIAAAAEGTPLFVEEMLSMLMDEGRLRRDAAGRWVAADDLTRLKVPPGIHALLAARLDQLPGEERSVLECGSVEGREFHRGGLLALVPDAVSSRLGSLLMSLVRKELIRPDRPEIPGEDAYRFRHQLIRDAAYQGLSKERRASLHQAFASWLEANATGMQELEEILGYHLEQAFRLRSDLGPVDEAGRSLARRAARLLASAGERAWARGDAPATAKLLAEAMDLLPPGDPERLALVPRAATALGDVAELAKAEALCQEAIDQAPPDADPAIVMRIRIHWLIFVGGTDPDRFTAEVQDTVPEATALFEARGDHLGLAAVWWLVAYQLNLVGHPPGMLEAQHQVLEHARLSGDRREVLDAYRGLATTLFWGSTPAAEGIRELETILEEIQGHRLAEQSIRRLLAGFLGMQGRFDEARDMLRTARATFDEFGARLSAATNGFMTGPLEIWAGDPLAAERELRESCGLLEAMGERAWYSSLAAFLAEALYQQGRLDEAEAWTRRAEEAAIEGDLEAQSDFRAVRAKILARRGDLEEAKRLAREAVDIVGPSGEPDHEGDAWFDLAEVLRMAERRDEAAEALRSALACWEAKGNVVSAAKAREALTALGAPSPTAPPVLESPP